MEKMEHKYQVILSTDGKLTIMGGVDKKEYVEKVYEELLPTFRKMVLEMKANNLQRKTGNFTKKEQDWTGESCPKDNGRLYHIITKTGKDMCKCENGKYNPTTGQTDGCDFVAWGKNLKDAAEQKAKWKEQKAKTQAYIDEPKLEEF